MKYQSNYYVMTPHDECLYIKNFSAWDHRAFKQFFSDIILITEKHYRNKSWCVLADSLEWELHTPDVNELVINAADQIPKMASHVAQIIGDSTLKKWQLEEMYKSIPAAELKTFEVLQDGIEWLKALGYSVPKI
ncbi:MAG: hypothetical protein MI892_18775 [Desulfobacterales bacterium]|nr:hypothetical protein [Desulfobacterales bacterium]